MGLSTVHSSPFPPPSPPSGLAEYFRLHYATLSRLDLEYASMADGRFGGGDGGEVIFEMKPAEVVLRVGGSLVTARPLRPVPGAPETGGQRGIVTGFSSASRKRLMRLIASLERTARPVFVTLTYPDIFDGSTKVWKRDIDVFGKRLVRKFPEAGLVWRIEFKERKSGLSLGLVAPHFHLLVYGVAYKRLREFVSLGWYGVVGSESVGHLAAGTRVEKIHSFGGIMRYVGKYISKVDDFPFGWVGRAWGVIGRKNLPWGVEVVISLSEAEGVALVRLGRKMISLGGKTLVNGLTWIVNAERVLDYIEFLRGYT